MRKILIDTSAYSQLLHGSTEVLNVLDRADLTYMSIFVTFDSHFKDISGLRLWDTL